MSNTFTRDPRPRIQYAGDGARSSFDLPFPVLASTPNPKQFLASARVVENTAPPSAVEASVEATARAD